ncbi:hypothetical protein Q604_UNBc4C00138G0001, partial [human gut metagenome]
ARFKTYHETGYVLSARSGIAGAGIFFAYFALLVSKDAIWWILICWFKHEIKKPWQLPGLDYFELIITQQVADAQERQRHDALPYAPL